MSPQTRLEVSEVRLEDARARVDDLRQDLRDALQALAMAEADHQAALSNFERTRSLKD